MKTLKEKLERNVYFNSKDILLCSLDCKYLNNPPRLSCQSCKLFFEEVKHGLRRCKNCLNYFGIDL